MLTDRIPIFWRWSIRVIGVDDDKVEDKEKSENLYQTAGQYYAMVKAHRRQQRAIGFRQMNPLCVSDHPCVAL